jgi:hypothetical protein
MKMRCPYLFVESERRVCKQLIEYGLDEELDDFDISHYCEGNPNHCFYFRLYGNRKEVTESPEENVSEGPLVSTGAIVLHEATKPDEFQESSSDKTDKFSKLKRLFRNFV